MSDKLTAKARQTVLETRKAEGRRWLCPDERPFKTAKALFFLLGGLLIVLLTSTLMGELLAKGDMAAESANYARLVGEMRMTALCLLLTAAGFTLVLLRRHLLGGGAALLEVLLFLISQNWDVGKVIAEGGWKRPVLFILPTLLFGLCGLYLLACDAGERVRVRRMRADFLRRIEAAHPRKGEGVTTAEEWDAYIEEFLAEPVHIKPKRSLKHRKKKED